MKISKEKSQKETRKSILSHYASMKQESELTPLQSALLLQANLTYEEMQEDIYDLLNTANGVSGFIYYADTVPFGQAWQEEILELLDLYGLETPKYEDETQFFSTLACIAWELFAGDVCNEIESK